MAKTRANVLYIIKFIKWEKRKKKNLNQFKSSYGKIVVVVKRCKFLTKHSLRCYEICVVAVRDVMSENVINLSTNHRHYVNKNLNR